MNAIPSISRKASLHRTLSASQKAEAALETLRGVRSVHEIAKRWDVNPAQLLQWQHTLVDQASSLFGEPENAANNQLAQAQLANEALILKVFEQMDEQDNLQQSTTTLHRLLAHQDQIKEDERKRIAREIHDDLGQNLLAIRIDISMLQDRTRVRHPRLHQRVSLVLANIDGAIRSIRSIINDLRPFELELGLPAALQWQVNRFKRMTGTEAQLEVNGFDEDIAALADEVTLTVFRILQESLSNIVQHANASNVDVHLCRSEDGVRLVVQDDGVGATELALTGGGSLGLIGMRERLGALGGDLILENLDSGGIRLELWIPVPPACPRP
jgi:signal transduction histidine kinase